MLETIPNDPTLGGPDSPHSDCTVPQWLDLAMEEIQDAKTCREAQSHGHVRICLDRAERFIDEARRAL